MGSGDTSLGIPISLWQTCTASMLLFPTRHHNGNDIEDVIQRQIEYSSEADHNIMSEIGEFWYKLSFSSN